MKVVLDAGHGYDTPGKRTSDGQMREWEFNSDVAIHVRNILDSYHNVEVKFVHDTTRLTDVARSFRVNEANKWGANVYVSIHANAHGDGKTWTDANGIETFVHPSKPKEAIELATKVQRNLVARTGLKDRGVKFNNFQVLDDTKMTAILCECGFMTNEKEAALLKSDSYRRECAYAIADALAEQYGFVKKSDVVAAAPQPAPAPQPAAPKPAPVNKYPGTLIREGSRNESVKKIQKVVGTKQDGVFGPKTKAAVKKYQKNKKLVSDGIVGPKTWNTMFK